MASKYEMPISIDYVPEWNVVDAVREIFQNALDNETETPENVMSVKYEDETLSIGNKTSVLELDSLLLGSSSKRDDERLIGKHGEGYKLAIMVLLREGKTFDVINYGKREKWETKLVKSRRYNNKVIPQVIIEKENIFKKIPDNDLIFSIGNITDDDYREIVEKNLHLQDYKPLATTSLGEILEGERYVNKIYVNGLYVCDSKGMDFGYNIKPKYVKLDRDRRLVDDFDLVWCTSKMWLENPGDGLMDLIFGGAKDVKYVNSVRYCYAKGNLSDDVLDRFMSDNGEGSVPVVDTAELERVKGGSQKPVIVNEVIGDILKGMVAIEKTDEGLKASDRLLEVINKLSGEIDKEIELELVEILEMVINLE